MSLPHSDTAETVPEILQLLGDYFDGLYFSDAVKLREVFHPRAHYVCVTSGALQYLTMDEYLPVVEKRESPASRNEKRQDKVVSIEFAGPVTALACVECAIGEKYFSDFLSLIRFDNRWRIISKVFHYELISSNPE